MEQKKHPNTKEASKAKKASTITVHNFDVAEIPIVRETPYNEWVNYGLDNLYPMDLIEAWQLSATHHALTNGIAQMIAGEGVEAKGKPEEMVNFEIFAQKVNGEGMTLQDLVDRTAFDLYLHGYFGWQIILNKARTKIAEVYPVPAEMIRAGKMVEWKVQGYFVSPDWENYRDPKFKPQPIQAWNPQNRMEPRQMLFTKQYRPSQFYYSTPDYIGAMNWILIDDRVSEFQLNNIENGFFPNAVIQFFNGEPPQPAKDALERKFINKFTGKGGKKIAFIYNEGRDEAVQFDTFEPARLDQRFRELMPEITSKIMVGHRVTSPILFGIKENTGLGSNADEIKNASLLFNKMKIVPYQNIIIRSLKEVCRFNGWNIDLSINTLEPIQFTEGGEEDATAEMKMSIEDKRTVLESDLQPLVLSRLKDIGETRKSLTDDGYVLVRIGNDLTPEGRQILSDYLKDGTKFASDISSNPEQPSELDEGLYKVRYEYSGPKDNKNRDFCDEVLTLDLIYRYEDINEMSLKDANPEFGTYDIFKYKGSYGCRHKWQRLVFFRKRDSKGRFMPPDGLLNDKLIGSNKPPYMPVDDSEATKVNP